MRTFLIGMLAAALAGVVGCSGSSAPETAEAPLVATGNEKLVSLKLPGMT